MIAMLPSVNQPGPPPELEDVVECVQAHRTELERMGVQTLAVFGSVARGDARPDSDVDLLVELARPADWASDRLDRFLSELFGRHVDLVPRHCVKRQLKDKIEGEAVEVLPEFKPREHMPPKQPREWRMYIEDMIEAAEDILRKTAGQTPEMLNADQDRLKVVAWDFQVFGEAIRNLPEELRKAHPEVDWSGIRAMRNRITHGYFAIDASAVCEAAEQSVPGDLESLRRLLAEE